MGDIYDQHSAAFSRVSAFVVLHNGKFVAKVAFKRPLDGSGKLYAYVHWLGVEMVRAYASGGGYDKRSAAVEAALVKMPMVADRHAEGNRAAQEAFISAIRDTHRGSYWDDRLIRAGFNVLMAV